MKQYKDVCCHYFPSEVLTVTGQEKIGQDIIGYNRTGYKNRNIIGQDIRKIPSIIYLILYTEESTDRLVNLLSQFI